MTATMAAAGSKWRHPVVKSAARVLAMLEYFSTHGEGATVGDVARALAIPQSSTSALLGSLASLDYLVYDRYQRKYRPAPRIALLGARIRPDLFSRGRIIAAMEEIGARTGQMVLLAAHNDVHVRYLHAVPGAIPMGLRLTEGVRPMLISAPGRLFFSTFSDEKVDRLVRRLNAERDAEGGTVIDLEAVRADVRRIRATGYAVALDTTVDGLGAVAVMAPDRADEPQLAITLIGPTQTIDHKAKQYAETVRTVLRQHLDEQAPA